MARKIRKHALPGDIACCHGPGIKALNCCVIQGRTQNLELGGEGEGGGGGGGGRGHARGMGERCKLPIGVWGEATEAMQVLRYEASEQ